MNFDVVILEYLNQFSHRSPPIDVIISFTVLSHLLKGGVMMTIVWWGWFHDSPRTEGNRQYLVAILLASTSAVLLTRALAMVLPFRARPMHDITLGMQLPIGMPQTMLEGWSSFPSDHAALFGCLAGGMFAVSKRAGWVATVYCVLVILLPRVYTGFHYPSDILAGYILGVGLAWLACREWVLSRLVRPLYGWLKLRPGLFYPALFLFSYQVATLFDDSRSLGRFIYLLSKQLLADWQG